MKLKLSLFLAVILVFTGCSQQASQEISPAGGSTPVNANKSVKTGNESSIEVDKGLLSTEITLPASLFEGQNLDEVIANAKEQGVSEVIQNEDGSLTYKMSKATHEKLMKETADHVLKTIDELKSGENFKSIQDVTYNDSFSEFTLVVDQPAYEGGFDGFAAFGIGMVALIYQTYDGVPQEKRRVTIDIKDQNSGEIFDTIIYPDAWDQQAQ